MTDGPDTPSGTATRPHQRGVPLPSRTQTRSISYHDPAPSRSTTARATNRSTMYESSQDAAGPSTSAPSSHSYWSQLRTGIATAAALRNAQVERETKRRNRRHAHGATSEQSKDGAFDSDNMGEFLLDSGKRRLPAGVASGSSVKKSPGHEENWQPLAHLLDIPRADRKSSGQAAPGDSQTVGASVPQDSQAVLEGEGGTLAADSNSAHPSQLAEEPESWLDSHRDHIPLRDDPLAFVNDKDLLDSDTDDDDDSSDDEGSHPQKSLSATKPAVNGGNSSQPPAAQPTLTQRIATAAASLTAIMPVLSPLTKGILKCVIAYFIASLFTYSFPLANFLAHLLPNHDPDALVPFGSLHMIATVAVYFHPARSFGSMIEADIFALGAFAYTTLLGLTSMLVAEQLHDWDQPNLSNLITVVVFIGIGTGVVGYAKVKMGKPTFNTACSLIFVSTFTVIVKEGSTHLGRFETDAIWQVMIVVLTGTLIANLVNLTIWPTSATTNLYNDITRLFDAYSTLLKLLTRTFLLDDPASIHVRSSQVRAAIAAHHSAYTSLQKNLAEAKFEAAFDRRIRGITPKITDLVGCLHRLGQHLGGLRNSCGLQNEILFGGKRDAKQRQNDNHVQEVQDIPPSFQRFLDSIGPHMRSLVFICARSLRQMQTQCRKRMQGPSNADDDDDVEAIFDEVESDMQEAMRRFKHEQTVALKSHNNQTMEPRATNADQEDSSDAAVSTAREEESILVIFFFIFTLEELAAEMRTLIRSMREMESARREERNKKWFAWARGHDRHSSSSEGSLLRRVARLFSLTSPSSSSASNTLNFPSVTRHAPNTAQTPRARTLKQRFFRSVWRLGEFLRQRDVKFAIKAGAGCALLASPAFMHSTRPTFKEYKGEWALISFMVVLSPTVGQSNQMGVHRVAGTIVGAIVASTAYFAFRDDNVVLPLIGGLFSVPCFRYIVGKPALASTGRFVLLTFNLTALYSYNVRKTNVEAEQVAFQRTVAVTIGVIWATMLNHLLWPNEARRELTLGLSDLLFKLSWLYQCLSTRSKISGNQAQAGAAVVQPLPSTLESQPLLSTVQRPPMQNDYQSMELHLQFQLIRLESLLAQTANEPRLKGPFPTAVYKRMLVTCTGVLDQSHSLRCIVERKEWKGLIADGGEIWTGRVGQLRREMVGNVLLFYHILASSLNLKTPLPPYLPPAESSRRSLVEGMRGLPMIKNQAWRGAEGGGKTDGNKGYLLIWSYCLCHREMIRGLQELGAACREAFGVVGGGELDRDAEGGGSLWE